MESKLHLRLSWPPSTSNYLSISRYLSITLIALTYIRLAWIYLKPTTRSHTRLPFAQLPGPPHISLASTLHFTANTLASLCEIPRKSLQISSQFSPNLLTIFLQLSSNSPPIHPPTFLPLPSHPTSLFPPLTLKTSSHVLPLRLLPPTRLKNIRRDFAQCGQIGASTHTPPALGRRLAPRGVAAEYISKRIGPTPA